MTCYIHPSIPVTKQNNGSSDELKLIQKYKAMEYRPKFLWQEGALSFLGPHSCSPFIKNPCPFQHTWKDPKSTLHRGHLMMFSPVERWCSAQTFIHFMWTLLPQPYLKKDSKFWNFAKRSQYCHYKMTIPLKLSMCIQGPALLLFLLLLGDVKASGCRCHVVMQNTAAQSTVIKLSKLFFRISSLSII